MNNSLVELVAIVAVLVMPSRAAQLLLLHEPPDGFALPAGPIGEDAITSASAVLAAHIGVCLPRTLFAPVTIGSVEPRILIFTMLADSDIAEAKMAPEARWVEFGQLEQIRLTPADHAAIQASLRWLSDEGAT